MYFLQILYDPFFAFHKICYLHHVFHLVLFLVQNDFLKTLSYKNKEGDNAILIVTAGDAKIDNKKFKAEFGHKAKMLTPEEVMEYIGHGIGGVCPFAIRNNQVKVYLDVSMKRFNTVFPAAGSSNSSIELTCDELERFSHADKWIDVCKGYETIE